MRTKLWMVVWAAATWACGGATFTGPSDGGSEGGGSSSSGSSGGSSSSSGASGSSSGSSGGSGSSSGSSGGSGSSSGTGSGSSSGGSTPSCPPNAPSGGTSCPLAGMECEYGDNANPVCNQTETCGSNLLWSYPTPGPACPTGTCPATYAAVPQGKDCTPEGLDCSYPEGQCNCAPTVPVSTPSPVWQCSQPAAGCPEPRPRIGSACTQPNLTCDYGACTGGVALQCTDGQWQVAVTACPV